MKNKETINLDPQFPFDIKKVKVTEKDKVILHCHDCLEINYIIKGKGINIIEDEVYNLNANDVYLINNFEHHMAVSHEDLEMIIIVFNPDFIWLNNDFDYDYLKSFFNKPHALQNCDFNNLIYDILNEMNTKETGYKLVIKAKLLEFLALCFRNIGKITSDINYYKNYDKLRELIKLLNNNIEKDLSLDFIAKEFHMNKTYLSTYFKENMGMHLKDYIKNLRINKAKILLRTSNKSITEICFAVGFNNMSHFSSIFKKQEGLSPSDYRNSEFNNNKSE